MSTRGVLIVRGKRKAPEYYYVRSDADMYPEFERGISGRTPKEYVNRVNRRVLKSVEGYEFSPDLIRPMDDIEAKNYVSSISATPDHVYVVDLGKEKKEMHHYSPNPFCGPDEIYIPAYVKEDGTYVHGFCRKRKE